MPGPEPWHVLGRRRGTERPRRRQPAHPRHSHPQVLRVRKCASANTQALRDRNLPEEDIQVLNKIIPDLLFDLRSAGEAFEDMKQMGLSGTAGRG